MTTKWIVRVPLDVFLLLQIWRHAHWSIGLSLTLLIVRVEIEDFLADYRRDRP